MANVSTMSRWLVVGLTALVLLAIAWASTLREASADTDSVRPGRDWSVAVADWGDPVCFARSVRSTARESAADRSRGRSSLLVPHAELVIVQPTPVQGRGSRPSNRMLVFSNDAGVRDFIDRHLHGDLVETTTETRVAIERPGIARLVEVDPDDRIVSIGSIRPVFLTVLK